MTRLGRPRSGRLLPRPALLLLDAYCSSQGVATASRQEQPRRPVLTRPLVVGGSSSAASDAVTAAPPSSVVESCRDDRLLRAAALSLSKHEVAATLATASPDGAPAAIAIATASQSWPRPTSAPSGGCSRPTPPTTLLVLVHCEHLTPLTRRLLRGRFSGLVRRRLGDSLAPNPVAKPGHRGVG